MRFLVEVLVFRETLNPINPAQMRRFLGAPCDIFYFFIRRILAFKAIRDECMMRPNGSFCTHEQRFRHKGSRYWELQKIGYLDPKLVVWLLLPRDPKHMLKILCACVCVRR